jgi:hypothetical protein
MPVVLTKMTFASEAVIAFVMKTTKEKRRTIRYNTKGRAGTDRISFWRELCVIMVRKNKVAAEADLDRIRAALDI